MRIVKHPLFWLFVLFMTDFALTHCGIQAGLILEGNPLWVEVFNWPLYISLPFRIIYFVVIIYLPLTLLKRNPDKCRPSFIKGFYVIAYCANLFILGMHLYWIISYARVV